ncbi:GtrA family protein [Vibrio coralliilyticus]|uniref:GtrA family protein n=1 Tax=Vibrio coralliilyticus TaxID=190893 RepID=UPI0017A0D374|nr:GtrA family protein [Vibrio coralliilyticus]NUW66075.1 GtrA family protein [Vibrio coralliilyticus]
MNANYISSGILRFFIVGVAAAFVHLFVAASLMHWSTLEPFVANSIGFFMAVNVSFFGHFHWTFRSKGNKPRAFYRFIVSSIVLYLSNSSLLAVLLSLDVSGEFGSVLVANLSIPIVSFILSKFWAFKD